MALKGVKVLEFAGLAPGPFCGMVLADFGATVIKIDRVGSGSNMDILSNGKKLIKLNLKTSKAADIVRKLSSTSDVLIEPFRPGVMESLQIGPDVLLKENPKLIYARLTGFGQSGYYQKRAGHDINYLGLTGLMSLFGRAHEKPAFPVNFAADFAGGGLTCALGIVMALYERSISGKGQVVDCNMVEGTAYLGSWLLKTQKLPYWGNERGKNMLDGGAHFYEVYETKDGKYMSVGAIEPEFYKALLNGLGYTLDEVPQFDFDKGKELLTIKFLEKSQGEWCKIFDTKDACVFPILSPNETKEHQHNKDRLSFYQDGDIAVPEPAPKLSRTPAQSTAKLATGEQEDNTIDFLKTLGYNEHDIQTMKKDGVIGLHGAKL